MNLGLLVFFCLDSFVVTKLTSLSNIQPKFRATFNCKDVVCTLKCNLLQSGAGVCNTNGSCQCDVKFNVYSNDKNSHEECNHSLCDKRCQELEQINGSCDKGICFCFVNISDVMSCYKTKIHYYKNSIVNLPDDSATSTPEFNTIEYEYVEVTTEGTELQEEPALRRQMNCDNDLCNQDCKFHGNISGTCHSDQCLCVMSISDIMTCNRKKNSTFNEEDKTLGAIENSPRLQDNEQYENMEGLNSIFDNITTSKPLGFNFWHTSGELAPIIPLVHIGSTEKQRPIKCADSCRMQCDWSVLSSCEGKHCRCKQPKSETCFAYCYQTASSDCVCDGKKYTIDLNQKSDCDTFCDRSCLIVTKKHGKKYKSECKKTVGNKKMCECHQFIPKKETKNTNNKNIDIKMNFSINIKARRYFLFYLIYLSKENIFFVFKFNLPMFI